ncbi:MAG: hypothetical protein FD145_1580 [Candidatus Saganbacteria bacterium]|uniref:Glycosyltransferase RgtA/B/C/D-like domain-containing protein n=1 Tax=Candidatus Saganbacteria bacterium TaxID=2575572 RepID=A0A833KZJ0_UNCSA|nr:MAG: hypothetical protein FD145_1580 [Candidatus Saganbacteria bacterium]
MIDSNLKKLIGLSLLSKICIFAAIYLAFNFLPFNMAMHNLNFLYPANEPINLMSAFKTWDAQQYLFLAEKGYSPNQMSNAFFPLFPLLIKFISPIFFGKSLIAGLALANIFSLVAVIYFYLFVKQLFGAENAFRAGLFFLAFPTSFYMDLVYADSLFLMLAILFFYFLYNHRTMPAFICAFLLPLSRLQGVLAIVPLLIFMVVKDFRKWFLPLGFAAGFASYLLFMQFLTGALFSGFSAQNYFVSGYSVLQLLNSIQWFMNNFTNITFGLHGYTNSIIDRFFFLFFLILLFFSYKKIDKTLFCYMLAIGLVPALAGNFMSYTRYLLEVFPIFIVMSLLMKEKHYFVLIPMVVLQTIFLISHALNYWIA